MLRMVTGALSLAVFSGCVVGYEYRQRPYAYGYGYGPSDYGSGSVAVADYNPGCSPDLPCDNTYYWDEWRSVYVYFDGARYHDATGLPGAYRPPPSGMRCGGVPMGYAPPSNYRGRPGQFSAPPSYRTPSWWASSPPPPPGSGYGSAPAPNPGRGYGPPPVANSPTPSGPPPGQANLGGIPAPRGWYGNGSGAKPPSSQTIDDGAHGGPSRGWPNSGPVGQGSPRPAPVVIRPQGEFPTGKPQTMDDGPRGSPGSVPVFRPTQPQRPDQPVAMPSRPPLPTQGDSYGPAPSGRVPGSAFGGDLPSRPSTMARNEGPHPQQQTFAGVNPKRDLRYRVDMDPLPSYDVNLPKLSPPPPPNPQANLSMPSPSFPSRKPTVFSNSPSAPSAPSAPGGPSRPMFGPRPGLR